MTKVGLHSTSERKRKGRKVRGRRGTERKAQKEESKEIRSAEFAIYESLAFYDISNALCLRSSTLLEHSFGFKHKERVQISNEIRFLGT